jgi:hypothetical protein
VNQNPGVIFDEDAYLEAVTLIEYAFYVGAEKTMASMYLLQSVAF